MKDMLMGTVSFTMTHINGNASVCVPVWFIFAYAIASMFWPIVAIVALMG